MLTADIVELLGLIIVGLVGGMSVTGLVKMYWK